MKIELMVKGDSPAIDPTGKTIAFNKSGYIWTIDIDGKNLRQLSNFGWDDSPAWSPDGQKIAFQSYGEQPAGRPQKFSIWTIDRNGKNPQRVEARSPDSQQYPRWSPDGRSLIWTQQDRIWIADADGKNGRPLTPKSEHYQTILGWSSDGKTLYYSGGSTPGIGNSTPTPPATVETTPSEFHWQIGLDGRGAMPMNAAAQHALLPNDGKYRYDCTTEAGIVRIDRQGRKSNIFKPQSPEVLTRSCLMSADRTKLIVGTMSKGGGRNFIYVLDLTSQ